MEVNTRYCEKCMMPAEEGKACPFCGYYATGEKSAPMHILQPGTILKGRYLLGLPLGQGGFGITYIGRDLVLNMRVAVKEYYPSGFASRYVEASERVTATNDSQKDFIKKGKERFLQEAQVLAQFHGNPGVVDVRDFFEENDTAYIVMEYLEGEDLRYQLKKELFSADRIFTLMDPIFQVLEQIHEKGIVHRDISPDNIMMMEDGTLKLMDFGAARLTNVTDQRSVSVVLKAGYAPEEQYRSKGVQGPWTDIYALCATIYKCITGITPDDSMERVFEDGIKWPSELGIAITEKQEHVLRKGMAVRAEDRYQSLSELRRDLNSDLLSDKIAGFNVTNGGDNIRRMSNGKTDDEKTVFDSGDTERILSDGQIHKASDEQEVFGKHNDYADTETVTEYENPAYDEIKGTQVKETISQSVLKKEPLSEHTNDSNKAEKKKIKKPIVITACALLLVGVIGLGLFGGIGRSRSNPEMSSLLWGSRNNSDASYDDSTGQYYYEYSQRYQTIKVNGEEYEFSLYPAHVEVDASKDASKIYMTFVDRYLGNYVIEGTYKISNSVKAGVGILTVNITGMDGKKGIKFSPENLKYNIDYSYGYPRLEKEGYSYCSLKDSANYKKGDDNYTIADTRFSLKGKVSGDSGTYKDIMALDIRTSGGIVYFTDGGYAETSSVEARDGSIYIKWKAETRPYNGRMVEKTNSGSISVYYCNNGTAGFILIDNDNLYYYHEKL